ncbi:hypothetical protein PTSG_11594 [Salpingoeca rosetta]|uniref:Carrier domain-containing protein n=1 Tax=Salpingoeca rosetta (strain ATCC 50818 / BSB-021) TaxID=946362 RepID=F2TWN1_SALR5|nr:uncharacterized protein PTSG_11594 [Salpingoeca rosetta]EGD72477.1 hypothetical protein PTSG_11594 [Salpingoeca rosetta]|eukprot:XP_004999046.1 hypothetical protein PTSG_11594 [Salpingoeca rosetta]
MADANRQRAQQAQQQQQQGQQGQQGQQRQQGQQQQQQAQQGQQAQQQQRGQQQGQQAEEEQPPQDERKHEPSWQARLEWWETHLRPATAPQVYTEFPHTVSEETMFTVYDKQISRRYIQMFAEHLQDHDLLLLTAFAVFIHKQTREDCFVVMHMTTPPDFLPVLIQFKPDMTVQEAMDAVARAMAKSAEMEVPIQDLVAYFDSKGKDAGRHFRNLCKLCIVPRFREGVDRFNLLQPSLAFIAISDWLMSRRLPLDVQSQRLIPKKLGISFPADAYLSQSSESLLEQVMHTWYALTLQRDTKLVDFSLVDGDVESKSDTAKQQPNPKLPLDDTWHGSAFSYLEKHAAVTPDKPLIFYNGETHTYKAIDSVSNRLANLLISKNIGKGDVVALFAHRCPTLVVGMMGVLKSGATLTIVDPSYPATRQMTYLDVARPRAIVIISAAGQLGPEVQKYIEEKLDIQLQHTLLPPSELGGLADVSDESPGVEVQPDDIATLSFTSGSTGKPKGVRGRHVSLTHFYPWMGQEFKLSADDRFTMLSGIAHDPIQRDVFTPIFFGASIHIPHADDIGNPGALAEWAVKSAVTVMHLTPAMGQLLMANAFVRMQDLRRVFFVGDILTKRDALRLKQLAPECWIVNMYGTTETQRAVSYKCLREFADIQREKDIVSAGVGMKDVELLVLDENMRVCAVGQLGELYVRSPHLSAGYLGLPEETNKKFIVNPFTNNTRDRLYRTGDLGRFHGDMSVECIGRADDQIKIRGFRIELGEIDSHLSRHPHVRENKTLVMRDRNEEKQIVAFFVPHESGEYDITSIREHMKKHVPGYAVPSVFYPLKMMPLTPNGKVDKSRLPFPDSAIILLNRTNKEAALDRELTETEQKIKDVFAMHLDGPIGLDDNFFDIGGHSILATIVTFKLRTALFQELPINVLYKYPTIRSLATVVTELNTNESTMSPHSRDHHETLDLEAETALDPRINGSGKSVRQNVIGKNVLLTGATGFLGAHLLHDLLAATEPKGGRVICLVRAQNEEHGLHRIVASLKAYALYDVSLLSRIIVLVGDLGQENFGLTPEAFEKLASEITCIFHNGAMVHWVYPYSKLKAANVQGTSEILRLACIGEELIKVIFVSSTSVYDSPTYMQMRVVSEDAPLIAGDELTTGYAQSKWVAEKLCEKARARNIPVTVFRPGYIFGNSSTGVMNLDDYLVRFLKACVEVGSHPAIHSRINMHCVDFVSRTIVEVGWNTEPMGACFNFWTPDTIPTYRTLGFALRSNGFDVVEKPYRTWSEDVYKRAVEQGDKSFSLFPLLHFVLDDLPTRSQPATLSCANLESALKKVSEISHTDPEIPVTMTSFDKFVGFLIHVNYLPRLHPDRYTGVNLPSYAQGMVRADTHSM